MSGHRFPERPPRVVCDGCDDDTARYVAVQAKLDGRTYPGLLCLACWRRALGPGHRATDAERDRLLYAVAVWRKAVGAPPADVLRHALEPLDGRL